MHRLLSLSVLSTALLSGMAAAPYRPLAMATYKVEIDFAPAQGNPRELNFTPANAPHSTLDLIVRDGVRNGTSKSHSIPYIEALHVQNVPVENMANEAATLFGIRRETTMKLSAERFDAVALVTVQKSSANQVQVSLNYNNQRPVGEYQGLDRFVTPDGYAMDLVNLVTFTTDKTIAVTLGEWTTAETDPTGNLRIRVSAVTN